MFQLTALILRGSLTSGEKLVFNLEPVMNDEYEVREALLRLQDFVFVRSAHFSQRNFFSDSGVAVLAESVAVCDSITMLFLNRGATWRPCLVHMCWLKFLLV